MQKFAVIFLVILVSACHKEFVSTSELQQKLRIKNSIQAIVPVTEMSQLNWDKMNAIESNGQLLGYHVPFSYNAPNSYAFVLANFINNEVGTIYRNDIKYISIHGGLYPEVIRNYNYVTHESNDYDTKVYVQQETIKMGMLSPMGIMAAGLHFPAVTTSGAYEQNANQSGKLAHIHSYILGFLLGLNEIPNNPMKLKGSSSIPYYNPLAVAQPGKAQDALIEWDIMQ